MSPSNRRSRKLSLTRSLTVVGLMIAFLSTQTPALPRPLTESLSQVRNDFKFWFHAGGWAKRLGGLIVQSGAPEQESQSDRDARVARIQALPGDLTIRTGVPEFFGALAYDSQDQQVGGVKFSWEAQDQANNQDVTISETGEFLPAYAGVFTLTAVGAGHTAQLTVTVSDSVEPADPDVLEEPPPGWDPGNAGAAQDPGNDRGDPPGKPRHHGAGTGNFQISAPVVSLPGRGIDVSLGLTYNSRVWTKSNTEIIYDIDRDWPAAGWSLGFGRMVGMGLSGSMIVDADGTRHSFSGTVTQPNGITHFEGHTTDGSFIDYNSDSDSTGIYLAQAFYPNGTSVRYGAAGRGAVYPKRIVDANGNILSIFYRVISGVQFGPKIDYVMDTLGRTTQFYYEQGKLTAITAPGIDGVERPLVRFLYKTITLSYAFSGLTPNVDDPQPRVLNAIYYPGTGTGYWFGDSDSYSSYGMLAKYSEQRGMVFSSPSLTTEGTITQGTITRQLAYNYPMTPDNTLTDAPTYSTMTETWAGMDTGPAITQYFVHNSASPRNTTIIFPDSTQSVQYSYNHPGQYDDGLIYEDDTYNSGNTLLRRSTVTWAPGDYGSARPTRIDAYDELSRLTRAEFDYGPAGTYNQVTEVRDFDYGASNRLRTTDMQYRNSTDYTNQHVFNLVKRVDVFDSSGATRVSRTDYNHDEPADTTLLNTVNVVQHDMNWDPYSANYRPATHFRGNVTSVVRYSDAANLAGAITETRTYDITGNMVTASTSCCEQMSFVYRAQTQFAYPEFQTRGSADPNSPARVTTSAVYNFNTGLGIAATDANLRVTQKSYFTNTLRPQTLTLPTFAYASYAYDDVAMSVTETVYDSSSAVASQKVKLLNGVGQVRNEAVLGQNSIWDYVDTKYDNLNRLWKQSRPYRTGQTPQWTETSYDTLGRVYLVTTADGSQSRVYFNETTRPSVASSSPGQTNRMVDGWGRERWTRLDANGSLVEVVEPNPSGDGTVATSGLVTTYSYDTLRNLTQVNQGNQQRRFKYDSLNRLTQQKLAEQSATLNDSGQYLPSGGTWSEVFSYDERSNLTNEVDARGVKTIYSYNSDPLNRLQSVTYDMSGFGDFGHPILGAAGVNYEYMTTDDKTRVFRVTTSGTSTDVLGYDAEGRTSSRTLTMTTRTGYPMVTNYIYDSLNRVTDVYYPAQYGMPGNPRKVVHQDYDVSSRLTGLKVDGADYAKNVVYNAASQTTSLKVGTDGANQITETYGYDDQTGLLTNQTVKRGATSLLDLSYDYLRPNTTSGRTGQLTKILNNLGHSRDRGYVYDPLGRLTSATGGQSANWSQTYVFDRYGNRTSVTATGTTGGTTLTPPSNLNIASASASSIGLTWTASPGADHYQIERRSAGNPTFQPVATSIGASYTDSPLASGAAYVYRVRAADAQNNTSGSSNARLGVAITFVDPTLVSQVTTVKAAHVTQLRQAVDGVRALAGQTQGGWTDPSLQNVQIKAVHIAELRTALTSALQALSLTVPGFTDSQLGGVTVKKVHIDELRAGIKASGAGDGGGGSGSPIPIDGLASVSYDTATNRINNAGWEYDAAGNQTRVQRTDGSWQRYMYDAAGRLVKIQNDAMVTQITHTYGPSNQRLIEQVGIESSNQRTYYAWAGDSVIAEYIESDSNPIAPAWAKSYVYLGSRLLATIAPSSGSERVEYQHADRLGTRVVTNNQDTTSFEQAALPFGRALDSESTGSTKRRFTTYDRSSASGLDYAVNRHYDPLQGRFTQVDPIGMQSTNLASPQTLNLYSYCMNDPINRTDPSGLGFFSFLGKVFGFIGKVLQFVAKVLAVAAAVAAVVFATWGLGAYAIAFAIMSGILFATAYGPPIVGKILAAVGAAARPTAVAGTTPINPNAGSGVGPVSSFMQGQQGGPQIGAAPPDKTAWWELFVDWIFSSGSKDRQFGPDADITQSLRTSPGVDKGRLAYCAQVANGGKQLLTYLVNFKIGAGIWGDDGILAAGLHMTRQFVGSFDLTMEGRRDGTVAFTAVNYTSLKSGLYHIKGVQNVKPGEGPFATQKQTYWWTESNPCGK